ncbi:PTS sugar transporter subunit IIC [Pseudocitrobacter corydidari]|uniref:Permease IIC component n=1 Tax=Pseudocitrobacter corydidari TaxID=2891570 RepID=A0ABY3RZB1_9ENTR|nr:PTS transporter subunit EIIC [Pseudocitrobacter corydidari]UGS39831.1 Lichenan permease IIC component [Pseudocitrobacter corydidari]
MKDILLKKTLSLAQWMGSQIHLRTMRDAFIMLIPFLVLSGMMILINNVVINPGGILSGIVADTTLSSWQTVGNKVVNGTMNILGMLIGLVFSYNLARNRQFANPLMAALVAVSCLFVLMPVLNAFTPEGATADVMIKSAAPYALLGTSGTFVALVCGGLATELFIRISKNKRLQIRIEGNVPPAVIQSFNTLFAVMITVLLFAFVSYLMVVVAGVELHELINMVIQKPLLGLATSLPAYILIDIINNFVFSLGINPGGITGAILEAPMLVAMQQNMDAWAAGREIPNIIVRPFSDLYGRMGGTGITLCLIIAVFIRSKRKELRSFSRTVMPTTLFNINEPVIFGFPIIFNPILMIPFTFIPSVLYVIAYYATAWGWVSKIVVFVPWSVPPLISGYLASGGDYRNVILQFILLMLGVLLYMPFLMLYEKVLNAQDNPAH